MNGGPITNFVGTRGINQPYPRQAVWDVWPPSVARLTAQASHARMHRPFTSNPSVFVFPASSVCFIHSRGETEGLAVFR